jgi:hypothetical protein
MAQGIDEEVRRTSLLAATLSLDAPFVETVVALNDSRGAREDYEAVSRIDERLSAFFNYTNKVGAVLLYLRDKPVFLHRNKAAVRAPARPGRWYEAVTRHATAIVGDLDSYGLDRAAAAALGGVAGDAGARLPGHCRRLRRFLDQVAEAVSWRGLFLVMAPTDHPLRQPREGLIDASLLVPVPAGRTTYVTAPGPSLRPTGRS